MGSPITHIQTTMLEDLHHPNGIGFILDKKARKEVDESVKTGKSLVFFAIDLIAGRHPRPEEEVCAIIEHYPVFLNQKLEEISAKLVYIDEHYELRPKKTGGG